MLFLPVFLWEWPILGILLALVKIADLNAKDDAMKKVRFKSIGVGTV